MINTTQGPQGDTGPTGEQGPHADYDSGWRNITQIYQNLTITHNLNYSNVLIDITGKTAENSEPHQRTGLSGYIPPWQKWYGGADDEYGQSVVQTSDGGYAIAGSSNSFGTNGGLDVFFVKTGFEEGLVLVESTANSVNLYRGITDPYWNCIRVQIWKIE